jgi:MFS family permease
LALIAATAALCGLLFGYDTGVISGALLFLKKDFLLSPYLQGVVTSAVLAGAAAGAGFSGRLADRFGRRRMVIAVAILFLAASFMTALASSTGVLILGGYWSGSPSASVRTSALSTLRKSLLPPAAAHWCR